MSATGSAPTPDVNNPTGGRLSRALAQNVGVVIAGDVCVMFQLPGDDNRYHFWVRQAEPSTIKRDAKYAGGKIYKSPPKGEHRSGYHGVGAERVWRQETPGYFETRQLDASKAKWPAIVADAIRQVAEGGLIAKAREAEEATARAAEHATLMQRAAVARQALLEMGSGAEEFIARHTDAALARLFLAMHRSSQG